MAATKMKLEDWLDDLCVRFINNLPEADLTSMARICFLVEEAHWFYEDFIRPLDTSLPSMNLRNFCLAIFQRCPLLAPFPIQDHVRAFEEFLKYKTSVPVRGAILLNAAMDHALLVKGWKKGANWSFPKGKINMDEDDLDCAIREVAEETGFDVREAGLVPPPEDIKFIESTYRDQQLRLYVFRDVPMDTFFEPRTRKEISKIQWYKIADLPIFRKKSASQGQDVDDPANAPHAPKFYMVSQFVGPLKKWVAYQKKRDAYRAGHTNLVPQPPVADDGLTEDETGAQSEPQFQGYQTQPPEGILDSASRELQRLLKTQPSPASRSAYDDTLASMDPTGSADPSQNKANALLAMLQKGGDDRMSPSGSQASLNHSYGQAPQPNAPHQPQHQEPYGPYASHSFQAQAQQQQQSAHPPLPFHQQMPSLDQSHGQGISGAQYNQYGAPHPDMPRHLQSRQPQQAQMQHQPQNYPYHQQQQQQQQQQHQIQHAQQAQQAPQNNQRQYAPNYANQPGPYMFPGNAAGAIRQPQLPPQPRPPIPLLHPQPLPPTVQKGLLARESFASPDVGESGRNAAGGYANMAAPLPSQNMAAQRPPLSNHAASLLSAFKSHNGARPESGPGSGGAPIWQQPQPPPQQQQQQQSPVPVPNVRQQYGDGTPEEHHLYGSRIQPAPQMGPHPGPRPQPGPQQQYGNGPMGSAGSYDNRNSPRSGSNSFGRPQLVGSFPGNQYTQFGPNAAAPRPSQPMDNHRNALLGIFKQPQPQQSQPQLEPEQLEQQEQQQPPPVPQKIPSTYGDNSPKGPASETDREPSAAGLQLPFGGMSLLNRPKGSDTSGSLRSIQQQQQHPQQHQPHQPHQPQQSYQPHRQQQPSPYEQQSSPYQQGSVRQPSLVSTPSTEPPPQTTSSEGGSVGSAPPPTTSSRRSDMSSDHKTKLLSLFGMPKLSPTASVSSRGSFDPRSREAGPGSAGGGVGGPLPVNVAANVAASAASESSRRGSAAQTPISSADRHFLLDYLASATKP